MIIKAKEMKWRVDRRGERVYNRVESWSWKVARRCSGILAGGGDK